MTEASISKASPRLLSIIVAASQPGNGIGRGGSLPWPLLTGEMGFFARVTKRIEPGQVLPGSKVANAVIMGRKTWESIPEKARPLKGRINLVVSSTMKQPSFGSDQSLEGPYVRSSLTEILNLAEGHQESCRSAQAASEIKYARGEKHETLPQDVRVSRIFLIGGSSLYGTALRLQICDRLLLTKIKKHFECDVFFPFDPEDHSATESGWHRATAEKWATWTGELENGKPKETSREQNGVPYEFCLYEREA